MGFCDRLCILIVIYTVWAATSWQLGPKQIGYVFFCSGRRSRVNVVNRDGGQSERWSILSWSIGTVVNRDGGQSGRWSIGTVVNRNMVNRNIVNRNVVNCNVVNRDCGQY